MQQNPRKTIIGAGFLMFNDKDVFLARESYDGKYSGFGGRKEKGEYIGQTAAREFYEESMGLYGHLDEIYSKTKFLKYCDTEIGNGKYFRTYMLITPTNHKMEQEFAKRYIQLRKTNAPKQFLEKDKAIWVPWADIERYPIRRPAMKTFKKIMKKL